MKGKIDSNGWLRIERGGKEKLQECPFMQRAFQVNDVSIAPCGDWCPLFDEPDFTEIPCKYGKSEPDGGAHLELCQTHYYFEQFTDERGKE